MARGCAGQKEQQARVWLACLHSVRVSSFFIGVSHVAGVIRGGWTGEEGGPLEVWSKGGSLGCRQRLEILGGTEEEGGGGLVVCIDIAYVFLARFARV